MGIVSVCQGPFLRLFNSKAINISEAIYSLPKATSKYSNDEIETNKVLKKNAIFDKRIIIQV